jgi:hypothetical protein
MIAEINSTLLNRLQTFPLIGRQKEGIKISAQTQQANEVCKG